MLSEFRVNDCCLVNLNQSIVHWTIHCTCTLAQEFCVNFNCYVFVSQILIQKPQSILINYELFYLPSIDVFQTLLRFIFLNIFLFEPICISRLSLALFKQLRLRKYAHCLKVPLRNDVLLGQMKLLYCLYISV